MKKLNQILFAGLILCSLHSNAQNDSVNYENIDKVSFGLGFGLNYGGFGGNFLVYPNKNFGLFLGGGYALAGPGFNAGAKIRFTPNKTARVHTYLLAMYGYNAAIKIQNDSQFDKLFYGPSLGLGFDFRPDLNRKGYWTLAVLLPIRSDEVSSYMDDLENNHGIEFQNELLPIAVSIGYRFIIN